MFQRKSRRFRHRSNSRGHQSRRNGLTQTLLRSNSFSNGQGRNNHRPQQSVEKLYEKYTTLAKEAMSSGDETSRENYLQHAEHFMRIIEEKNKNKFQNNVNNSNKPLTDNKIQSENNNIKQVDEVNNIKSADEAKNK